MRAFLSHLHRDDDLAIQLKRQLRQWSERSIAVSLVLASDRTTRTSSESIKEQVLIPRLRWAQAVLVLVTPLTCASPWIRWEIDFAKQRETPIIAVTAPSVDQRYAGYVTDSGGIVCDWDWPQIDAALNR